MCEEYNGWTNRETWGLALHIDNDESLQETASELIAQAFLENIDTEKEDGWQNGLYEAEKALADWVDDIFSPGYWGQETLSAGLLLILKDVGSLYRVNFREIAEGWLEDEIQSFKEGKYKEEGEE
jgi:hypothetical protein